MPSHTAPTCDLEDRADRRYLAEITLPSGSPLIGAYPKAFFADKYPTLELFEIVRGPHIFLPEHHAITVQENDLLLVKGSATDLVGILNDKVVGLPHSDEGLNFSGGRSDALIVELIIPPQSSLIGEKLLDTHLQGDPDAHIIAIKRRRLHYSAQKSTRSI